MRDDELKDLQDFAAAMSARMDALVANADALRRLLEQVGATHQAAVAQLAEAQRQGLERAIAARVEGRRHEPLREAKPRKSRSAPGKRAAAGRSSEEHDRDSVAERTASSQRETGSEVVAFERRERSQTM